MKDWAENNRGKLKVMDLRTMYGAADLATYNIFQGGFINFGYWEKSPARQGKITEQERIQASIDLYQRVWDDLDLKTTDHVLEVGSGRGLGCALLLKKYDVAQMVGLDATLEQIERAKQIHAPLVKQSRKLNFVEGKAEAMPFVDQSFDKIYSLEAAQHFISVPKFIGEAQRILKPGGKFTLCTFFARDSKSLQPLKQRIPTIAKNIDRVIPIDKVMSAITKQHFTDVRRESIGEHVWSGFVKWCEQVDPGSWNPQWLSAYQQQLLDYFLINATRVD